jgi:hypothetical protein
MGLLTTILFGIFFCSFSFGACDDLRKSLNSPQLKMEELLNNLPEEYKSNYVLMYGSKSLHKPNHKNPRVIMSSKDAKCIIAYSGNEKDPRSNILEMIEFDENSKTFKFSELEFKKGSQANSKKSYEFREDVKSCTSCHGNPARPNWHSYPSWPGVYGSAHINNQSRIAFGSQEFNLYKEFLETSKNNPRYELLKDKDQFLNLNGGKNSADDLSGALNNLNNKRISSQILNSPNYSEFKYVLAAQALGCSDLCSNQACDDFRGIEEYVPVFKDQGSYLNTLKVTTDKISEDYSNKTKKAKEFNSEVSDFNFDLNDAKGWAAYQYIADRMKLDISNWSLAFENGTYTFRDSRWGGSRALNARLIIDMAEQNDPDLQPLTTENIKKNFVKVGGLVPFEANEVSFIGSKNDLCASLKNKSVEAFKTRNLDLNCSPSATEDANLGSYMMKFINLDDKTIGPTSTNEKNEIGLIQKYCLACHGPEGDIELNINFKDIDSIKKFKTADGKTFLSRLKNGSMPPNGAPKPSESERGLMIKSLNLAPN